MTNPAAPPATPPLEEFSRILNVNLEAMERVRETIETSLATAIRTEVSVRRMGLREANHQVDGDSEALADASRLQQENTEAFHQLRGKLVELCACIDRVKGQLISLDAQLQAARTG